MWIVDAVRRARRVMCAIPIFAIAPASAAAQTDYFNTDRGRPLHVQDATAIERYAFELQAAPVRWSRSAGARVLWSVEPELAYGVLPRTQLEVGLPIFAAEGFGDGREWGVGAVHVSVLHALNVETLGWPALAINAAIAIPGGDFGPQRAYATLGAIATRTTTLGRVHLNVDATPGPALNDAGDSPGLHDVSRWTAGVAVDRALPLRSMLLGAEVVAQRPLPDGAEVDWRAAAGVRWQVSPYWAFDAGVGRSFGDDREWSLTFGAARAFGLRKLFPVSR
jgi:hypothetical protein